MKTAADLLSRLVWLPVLAHTCLAGGFSSMYVFGDSLSAVTGGGTQYPPPAGTSVDNYFSGRFSNGRVWVEYLADLQGVSFRSNNDYSNFGDDSGEVSENIIYGNYYRPPDIATSLYVFWSGSSDCFLMAGKNDTNSWMTDIHTATDSIAATVDLLYRQGVRTLVLPNSVDISKVPFFSYTFATLVPDPSLVAPLIAHIHRQVPLFNAALAATISQLSAKYPALKLYAPDFYSQFDFLYDHPATYGVTRTDLDALEDSALTDKSFNGPGADYLFWDYLHPTTRVHAAVASFVQQIVSPLQISRLTTTNTNTTVQFELVNLPIGRTGFLESSTNLFNSTGWSVRAKIVVTQATQTFVLPTLGLGEEIYFRLNFPR